MNFKLEHTFEASADQVLSAMTDPAFPDFMVKHMKMMQSVEKLDRREDGGKVEVKLRCVPTPIIDKVGPKKVPPAALAFTQELSVDRARKEGKFRNVPDHGRVREHLESSGTLTFREEGGKTYRTLQGELKVGKLPFLLRPLAGIAEQLIYQNAEKMLQEEARALQDFLKSRKA